MLSGPQRLRESPAAQWGKGRAQVLRDLQETLNGPTKELRSTKRLSEVMNTESPEMESSFSLLLLAEQFKVLQTRNARIPRASIRRRE